MSNNTAMVSARTFYTTLAEVVKRASKDKTLPQLYAVKLIVKNGVLFMVATDRYRIAVGRMEAAGLDDVEWLAGRDDVDALLGTMRAHKLGSVKSYSRNLELHPGETWTIVAQSGVELKLRADWDADFPRFAHFLNVAWDSGVVMAGKMMGADKNYHYGFSDENSLKPQVFVSEPGAEFDVRGVIMPVNPNGHDGRTPWDRVSEFGDNLEGK